MCKSVTTPEVIVNIKIEILEPLIKFLYCGVIEMKGKEMAKECGIWAHFLGIPKVITLALEYITGGVTSETCLELWILAKTLREDQMTQKALNFAVAEFQEVIEQDTFKTLDYKMLKEYLSVVYLITDENSLVKSILLWIEFDFESRNVYFQDLMTMVDVTQLTNKVGLYSKHVVNPV